jgi:hypothetical protein
MSTNKKKTAIAKPTLPQAQAGSSQDADSPKKVGKKRASDDEKDPSAKRLCTSVSSAFNNVERRNTDMASNRRKRPRLRTSF